MDPGLEADEVEEVFLQPGEEPIPGVVQFFGLDLAEVVVGVVADLDEEVVPDLDEVAVPDLEEVEDEEEGLEVEEVGLDEEVEEEGLDEEVEEDGLEEEDEDEAGEDLEVDVFGRPPNAMSIWETSRAMATIEQRRNVFFAPIVAWLLN